MARTVRKSSPHSSRKKTNNLRRRRRKRPTYSLGTFFLWIAVLLSCYLAYQYVFSTKYVVTAVKDIENTVENIVSPEPEEPALDKEEYDERMRELANCPDVPVVVPYTKEASVEMAADECIWPVDDAPYPLPGALLPFNRIVAYYGNFYSKNMGVLGQYPEDRVLDMLREEIAKWEAADPNTPVVPAIDYIAVTAQATAGPDGNYNLRMPDDQIEHAIDLAEKVNGVVILEVQAGLSDLQKEIELLEKFLKMPQVHLAIDPEFNMKRGNPPGTWIGTVDAADVNAAAEYLAELVREYDLPPKVLVVHRFTHKMVTNYQNIEPLPEVQIVIDMDGWGTKARKRGTYYRVINPEPVQFTGFKIFYENDTWEPSTGLMTPRELLDLRPQPIFIQYQ